MDHLNIENPASLAPSEKGAQPTSSAAWGLSLLLTTVAFSACSHSATAGRSTTSAAAGTEETPNARGALTLVNRGDEELCYVYLTPSDEASWGDDQLGSGESLPPGLRRSFDLPRGTYDIRINDCDQTTVYQKGAITVGADAEIVYERPDVDLDWPGAPDRAEPEEPVTEGRVMADGPETTFTIVNRSEGRICFVYLSPSSYSDWGPDWLGSTEIIEAGARQAFDLRQGTYDIRLEDCENTALYQHMAVPIGEGAELVYELPDVDEG